MDFGSRKSGCIGNEEKMILFLSSIKTPRILILSLILICILKSFPGTEKEEISFLLLFFQGFIGVSLLLSLFKTPLIFERPGRVLSHLGVLMVLIGALGTYLFREEGFLSLKEGERKCFFEDLQGKKKDLGFMIELNRFSIQKYPKPWHPMIQGFESQVRIVMNGKTAPWKSIEVNKPLKASEYNFYQSGYDPGIPGKTVLQVVKDPGIRTVFFGFLLLNLGAFLLLFESVSKRTARNTNAEFLKELPLFPNGPQK